MHNSFVIVDQLNGIYVGHALGLGFWSKLDTAGQFQVAAFTSADEAADHIKTWISPSGKADYTFHEVKTERPDFSVISELISAGLESELGFLPDEVPSLNTMAI